MRATLASTERELEAAVRHVARLAGWLCYKTNDSRRSPAGFPDLTLCRGPRLLFVELKSENGRLRPEQNVWINALRGTGADVRVWRPADWPEIITELTTRSRSA